MRTTKIWIYIMVAALVFTTFFTVFAAAEGTSFDDAQMISEGTYTGSVSSDYYYMVSVPAYKAILVTLTAGSGSSVSLQLYNENRQDTGIFGYASAQDGSSDNAFYDAQSSSQYTVYIKVTNDNLLTSSDYTIKVEFRPGDVMAGAQEITDGQTVSSEIKYSAEVHWYKISVPKGKLLNVSYSSNGGDIEVTLYDSSGKEIDYGYGENGYVSTELLGETGTIYIKVTAYEYNKVVSYTLTPHLKTGSSEAEKASNAAAMTCLAGAIIGIVIIILIVVLILKKGKSKKTEPPSQQLQQPPK